MCDRKETNFFAQESSLCLLDDDTTIRNREEYEALFKDAGDAKAIGETSPAYLAVVPEAPERISELIPEVKMISILRNPIERAYSHFLMRKRQGRELRASFEQCIEDPDIDPERSYKSRGFYGAQLSLYLNYFKPKQLKILLYEKFTEDPFDLLEEIFTFLKVDPTFKPNISERYNANPPADPMPREMRKKMIDIYRDDVMRLQKITGYNLLEWLETHSN